MKTKPNPETVSREFRRLIQGELNVDDLIQIDERNRRETDPNICHSHDFLDANCYMSEAMLRTGFDDETIGDLMNNETAVAVWNHAWNIAKTTGFATPVDGDGETDAFERVVTHRDTDVALKIWIQNDGINTPHVVLEASCDGNITDEIQIYPDLIPGLQTALLDAYRKTQNIDC